MLVGEGGFCRPDGSWFLFSPPPSDTNYPTEQCSLSLITIEHYIFQKQLPSYCQLFQNTDAKLFFSKVDMEYLLANSQPINVMPFDGSNEWDEFVAKPRKPF